MFKIIDNLNVHVFKEKPLYSINKKFIEVPKNLLSKHAAIIVKVNNNFFALENVTIISKNESINFISNRPIQILKKGNKIKSKVLKKIFKIKRELNNKFQYGLYDNELKLLLDVNYAFQKYKLLMYHKLFIINKEEKND